MFLRAHQTHAVIHLNIDNFFMFFSCLRLTMCDRLGGVTTYQFPNAFFLVNSSDLSLYFRLHHYGTERSVVKLLYFFNLCFLDQAHASSSK